MTDAQLQELKADLKTIKTQQQDIANRLIALEINRESDRKELDSFKGGVSRGLWMIGGGFIVAFVGWITRGGLV